MTLKDRIKTLANSRGMSLPALESELGFGNSTIVKWDKSSPNVDKLNAVANFFDVSIDYLLNGTSNQFEGIEGIYLSYAKEAQDSGIEPDDIKMAIETIKRIRKGDM